MPSSTRRFEGSNLEALLEEVRAELGPGAAIVEANKLRTGGLAGFFAKERFEVVVEVDGVMPPPVQAPAAVRVAAPRAADVPAPAPAPAPVDILDLVDRANEEERPPTPFASVLKRVAADVAYEVEAPSAPAPAHAPAPTRAPSPPPVQAPVEPALPAAALGRVGLPAHLVPRSSPTPDVTKTLLTTLESIPQPHPLPNVQGAVVAIVGPRLEAMPLARRFASDLGEDPGSIVLVSETAKGVGVPAELRLTTADAASQRRREWRRRRQPTVVVVDAAPARQPGSWARAVLDALEPTAVWATVDACRKPEDVRAWVDQLGGVDALAVNHLDDTTTPAAVLELGVPVGRLDGRPATPALWAALLSERLVAA